MSTAFASESSITKCEDARAGNKPQLCMSKHLLCLASRKLLSKRLKQPQSQMLLQHRSCANSVRALGLLCTSQVPSLWTLQDICNLVHCTCMSSRGREPSEVQLVSASRFASMEHHPCASSVVVASIYSDYIPAVGHCSIDYD